MPPQGGSVAVGQQVETIIEARGDFGYPERSAPRRCQLDCQWDAIEMPADRRSVGRDLPLWSEMRICRTRPCDKQPYRTVPQQFVHVSNAVQWHGERRHPVQTLTLDAQRLAARRQHPSSRIGVQQRTGRLRRRSNYMLAIIEQQHKPLTSEGTCNGFDRNTSPAQIEPQCRRDRGWNKIGIRQRCQLGNPHPVGSPIDRLAGSACSAAIRQNLSASASAARSPPMLKR